MDNPIIQLTLAIAPALAAGIVIQKAKMPWEKKKRPGERAEILSMLAKDIKKSKLILAHDLHSVKAGKKNKPSTMPLSNWNKLKTDYRLRKYSDEPIFKEMIKQFHQLERIQNI